MDKIIVDFGNLVEEMKTKQIKLCLLHNRVGWFVIDNENRLYKIETYYCGGFLDKYIKEKIKIKFDLVPMPLSNNIENWEKEVWDAGQVENFIDSQSKYW